jgi:hypothetical protein
MLAVIGRTSMDADFGCLIDRVLVRGASPRVFTSVFFYSEFLKLIKDCKTFIANTVNFLTVKNLTVMKFTVKSFQVYHRG